MKKLYFSVFSMLAFIFLTAQTCTFPDMNDVQETIEEGYNDYSIADKEVCEAAGGTYKEFSNGCADSCNLARSDDIGCIQSFSYGCDCGNEMCWNGTSCEAN